MLNVRSIADMARTIAGNLHRIDRRRFDVVVGIPRSGMLPASMIATTLQLPLADVRGYRAGIVHGRSGVAVGLPGQRVLLVDDSCNKGSAFREALALLPRGTRATRLAVYGPYQVEPDSVCDLYLEECPGPRVFAWNMAKHIRLARWGFDFDGVLCRDPTKAENDDGPAYLRFLRNAEPMMLPRRTVGAIVTARLEKYRADTVEWLKIHGIGFERLVMMPHESKAARMAAGNRGGWKAEQIRALGLEMFIESSPKQARIIAREAGIPVWCTATQELAA